MLGGEIPGESTAESTVDEPGRNPITGSHSNCFENVKLMCFKRLLPHSVVEQAFASLSKYSC